MSGITKVAAITPKTILFGSAPIFAVGINVSATGAVTDDDGNKVFRAGTPFAGDLKNRATAFTVATGADAVGVLMHDVYPDVDTNTQLIIHGFINLDKMDADTQALITADVETAVPMIKFLKY